jgi:hypothetical protein
MSGCLDILQLLFNELMNTFTVYSLVELLDRAGRQDQKWDQKWARCCASPWLFRCCGWQDDSVAFDGFPPAPKRQSSLREQRCSRSGRHSTVSMMAPNLAASQHQLIGDMILSNSLKQADMTDVAGCSEGLRLIA